MKSLLFKTLLFWAFTLPASAGLIKVDVSFESTNFLHRDDQNIEAPIKNISGSFSFLLNDPKLNADFYTFYTEFNKKLFSIDLEINGFRFTTENTDVQHTTYFNKLHTVHIGGIISPWDTSSSMRSGTTDFWLTLSTSAYKDIATGGSLSLIYMHPDFFDPFYSKSGSYNLQMTPVPEAPTFVIFGIALLLMTARKWHSTK